MFFFTHKKTPRCKSKNLCMHLIKQHNNYCVNYKAMKKNHQQLKKN